MRYPRGGVLESVGSTTLGLDERGRPGDEDVCCQVEEWTKRTPETVPSEEAKGQGQNSGAGKARQVAGRFYSGQGGMRDTGHLEKINVKGESPHHLFWHIVGA